MIDCTDPRPDGVISVVLLSADGQVYRRRRMNYGSSLASSAVCLRRFYLSYVCVVLVGVTCAYCILESIMTVSFVSFVTYLSRKHSES